MKKEYDVVIIGGGPAGYTAALYCARSGYSTLILEKFAPGGQMATTGVVENYPGFEDGIDGFDLAEKMQKGSEKYGVETEYAQVEEVRLKENPKKIITSSGEVLGKTVMLAMGAMPRELGLSNEQSLRGRGVSYCATCDGRLYKDKTVVIVGGGNSAVADALVLAKLCKEVHLVHRRDELRATKNYLGALAESGTIIHWNSAVKEILVDKRVNGVLLENVETREITEVNCDGVFVAIGRIPDTEIVKGQIELDSQGYILAGEDTKTNISGVFAIGDVRTKPMRQIVTATADGATSAKFVEEFLN